MPILLLDADMKLTGSLSLAMSLTTMIVGFTQYSLDRSQTGIIPRDGPEPRLTLPFAVGPSAWGHSILGESSAFSGTRFSIRPPFCTPVPLRGPARLQMSLRICLRTSGNNATTSKMLAIAAASRAIRVALGPNPLSSQAPIAGDAACNQRWHRDPAHENGVSLTTEQGQWHGPAGNGPDSAA